VQNKDEDTTTRRIFLKSSAAVAAAAVAGSSTAARGQPESPAPAAPSANVLETRVISPQSQYYHGWPTLARRRSGQLLLAWSGGREAHVCPFGRVDYMTSDDDGATWTWPRTLLDSGIDDRDAGALETAEGTILVTTFTSLAYENILAKGQAGSWPPERLARWQAAHRRLPDEQRKTDLGEWMLRSTDGGRSWSARYPTIVNSPHGPIQLSDGRLLYAGKELWTEQKRIGVCESTDDGQTWRWLAEIPARQGDNGAQYHELHAVETADGRMVVHIRNHNKTNERETLQTESENGGRTWSTPRDIGVWGLPSHLLRLSNDSLLMTYGHRRPPFGNQARLSTDHGRTWSEPMIISGDGPGGDLGYPTTVQLAGQGEPVLLTVWYEVMPDSPMAVLRQARWRLEA
jgi:sialidase-1